MPHNLTGVRVLAPPDEHDHFLVTRHGNIFRFSISEPDYTVGRTRGEMLGFPGGAWVPASSAPGRLPEAVSYELTLAPRPADTLRWRTEELVRALPLAAELHRPDGRYLRVYSAEIDEYADGGDTITALFKPKSERWRYPLLDDAFPEVLSTVFETEQSTEGAPIYATTPGSRLVAPITAARLPQGTMFVGFRTEATGVYGIASLGAAVGPDGLAKPQALGMYKANGVYKAHVGAQAVNAPQDAAGGYGLLKVFSMRWRENGLLSFYSFGANGFVDHGSSVLGEIEPFALRQITLGVLSNFAGVDGFFMPGAPALGDFGVPFYTARYWTEREIEDAAGSMYSYLAQFSNLTILPPPYGLTLTIAEVPEAVVGRDVQVPINVERSGGFLGEIEFEVKTSDPALRYAGIVESEESYTLILTPEEGIAADTYSVEVTVRAVGQDTSAPFVAVIDTKTLKLIVRLGDPALPEGTTGHNAMYDPRLKSFVTMAKSETGAETVQRSGLMRWTARWDGIYCDGTNTEQYGPSLAWVDTGVEMGGDHSVSVQFWDVPGMSENTVLMTFSSRTLANKLQYWQVYKAADGLRLKTSFAGTTFTSGQGLPLVGGIMDISVVRSETGLTLLNPKTEDSIATGWRAWAGLGRLTFFGAKLADGTVQGLSKGIVLGTARQNRAVSTFQLERQAEYMRGFVLRTAQWERKEYGDGVSHIWLADPSGVLRNYHPATADKTMISKGTGAVTQSGSFVTNGADETGWRTGWLTGTDAAKPTDVVVVMDDMGSAGSNGKAQIGVAMYNEQNNYTRTAMNGNPSSSRVLVSLLESTQGGRGGSDLDTNRAVPLLGKQSFLHRFDKVNRRAYVQHLESGKQFAGEWDDYPYSGPIQVSIGCSHRGLSSTGTVRGDSSTGLEHEIAAKCRGIVVAVRHQSASELAANAESISDSYDYSQAPVKGLGGGGSTPPPPSGGTITLAADDLSPVALATAAFSANTLFGTSGTLRTLYDRLVPQLTNGGYGNQANTPMYTWTDTSKSLRGQYHIARQFGAAATNIYLAICATKDLRWAKQAQALWNNARAAFDRNSSAESTASGIYDGWGYGTMPSGAAIDSSYGKRIRLEAGVAASGMVAAYVMHVNSHLDSSFAASVTQMTNWWDNHYTKEWDFFYGSGATGSEPLHSRKSFTHTVWAEMAGGFARAKIRAGAAWASDPEGVDIINAWGRWYQSHTTVVIPVADFRDPAWASYGPARLWGQRAKGWSAQSGGGQFSQPQTYLNRTWGCMMFLYLEGFLTHVLGSQAAADNFMTEVVSGANLGVWVEPLRAKRQVADAINGMLAAADHPSGVLAPWMYITNPMGSTNTDYQSEDKILKSYAPFMALDSSNRLQTIFDDVITRYSSARSGENSDYVGGNITRILSEVYKNGRKK